MTAQILRPTISSKNKKTNSQVRDKFFRRIGVAGRTDPNDFGKYPRESADGTVDPCTPTRDLQKVPRYSTQLKYNRNDEKKRMERLERLQQQRSAAAASADKNSSVSSSESSSKAKKSKPKRCTFDETVKVVPIPKRNEYSDRIRSRLWSNTIELYENAARNHVEFAAENYDWRNACDDEEMCVCRISGEKIHPVHYEMLPDPHLEPHHSASPSMSSTAMMKYWAMQDVI